MNNSKDHQYLHGFKKHVKERPQQLQRQSQPLNNKQLFNKILDELKEPEELVEPPVTIPKSQQSTQSATKSPQPLAQLHNERPEITNKESGSSEELVLLEQVQLPSKRKTRFQPVRSKGLSVNVF